MALVRIQHRCVEGMDGRGRSNSPSLRARCVWRERETGTWREVDLKLSVPCRMGRRPNALAYGSAGSTYLGRPLQTSPALPPSRAQVQAGFPDKHSLIQISTPTFPVIHAGKPHGHCDHWRLRGGYRTAVVLVDGALLSQYKVSSPHSNMPRCVDHHTARPQLVQHFFLSSSSAPCWRHGHIGA